MSYQTLVVADITPGKKTSTGQTFLRVLVRPPIEGASARLVYCFHKSMFERLEKARASAAPVVLDILTTDKLDGNGDPYQHIDGYEDPNQMDLFKGGQNGQ